MNSKASRARGDCSPSPRHNTQIAISLDEPPAYATTVPKRASPNTAPRLSHNAGSRTRYPAQRCARCLQSRTPTESGSGSFRQRPWTRGWEHAVVSTATASALLCARSGRVS